MFGRTNKGRCDTRLTAAEGTPRMRATAWTSVDYCVANVSGFS